MLVQLQQLLKTQRGYKCWAEAVGQQPIVDLVESLISTDTDHTFHSCPDLVDAIRKVPPYYYFGVAESRPEGLVDLLILGDSTTAL